MRRIASIVLAGLSVGSLALLFGAAYGLTRLSIWAKRRLLWRVRRKLILSYVFVGVVPALLVIVFFLLAGLIVAFNVSSYLVQSRLHNVTDQARFLARTVQLEVQRATTAEALAEILREDHRNNPSRYAVVISAEGAIWKGAQVADVGEAVAGFWERNLGLKVGKMDYLGRPRMKR